MIIRLEKPEEFREVENLTREAFWNVYRPGWLAAQGIEEATYCPPKGYFVADEYPEAFEAYDATFPHKEKLRLPGQLDF